MFKFIIIGILLLLEALALLLVDVDIAIQLALYAIIYFTIFIKQVFVSDFDGYSKYDVGSSVNGYKSVVMTSSDRDDLSNADEDYKNKRLIFDVTWLYLIIAIIHGVVVYYMFKG